MKSGPLSVDFSSQCPQAKKKKANKIRKKEEQSREHGREEVEEGRKTFKLIPVNLSQITTGNNCPNKFHY